MLFKVHEKLGRYAREKQYGDLFAEYLLAEHIKFNREKIVSRTSLDINKPDFTIEDCIVVEFKAKSFIIKEDDYQTMRYLEIVKMKLGMIVNFRQRYLKPKRIINSKATS
ncbi:MAG: GxxExxY protein [Bacteroidetes bacterium]|nr:GxxExxY protein [Bacteroidota bacterium]